MFHRLLPLLEPWFRVIVFDNRGVGNSCSAGGLQGLSIDAMAADVVSVIDDAAGGCANVFGVSLGGIVAQELALAYPRSVNRLILAGTHTADERLVLADQAVFDLMKSRPSMNDEEAIRSSLPFVYSPDTPQVLIEEDVAIRRAMHTGWEGYQAQLNAVYAYEGTSSRLPRLSKATLVLHGALDEFVPPANGEVIASRVPGCELRILDGVSHNCYSEAAPQTAAAIIEFLHV
ncbi:alpha/beta hydrolase [Micrococcales bacterium 31B]|nr:alpha/beta hydrolase [Micrococcales bacterium 31B]